jgi:hypothetical protein
MPEHHQHESNINDLIVAAEASAYQALSIMGALVEKGLIDPQRVAAFATFFADGIDKFQQTSPEVKAGIRQRLFHFAKLIDDLSNKPWNVGSA